MTRSERFASVLKIAELKKRNAARASAQAKQKLHEYEKKLYELLDFRNEYTLGDRAVSQSVTASQLQQRQKFIQQLDEGINILRKQVAGQKQSSEMDKQVWLDAYKHTNAMDKLMSKIRKTEIDLLEARETNEVDDRSQHRKLNI